MNPVVKNFNRNTSKSVSTVYWKDYIYHVQMRSIPEIKRTPKYKNLSMQYNTVKGSNIHSNLNWCIKPLAKLKLFNYK